MLALPTVARNMYIHWCLNFPTTVLCRDAPYYLKHSSPQWPRFVECNGFLEKFLDYGLAVLMASSMRQKHITRSERKLVLWILERFCSSYTRYFHMFIKGQYTGLKLSSIRRMNWFITVPLHDPLGSMSAIKNTGASKFCLDIWITLRTSSGLLLQDRIFWRSPGAELIT